ncbi:hypothetical protein IWQ60_007758 [Tieghemiomyces parasiticus]|uniref:Uncharacterized protein n=1 Tax=Tieghemiomyces parasiticus TaxID=78921 RepID=A0A9W7ZVJ3_9FUNG|nr:hypothetical protein IWQ60_007758 [Tieghemiomyces parasiticus]
MDPVVPPRLFNHPYNVNRRTQRPQQSATLLPPPIGVNKLDLLTPALSPFFKSVFFRYSIIQRLEYFGVTPLGNIYTPAIDRPPQSSYRDYLGWATYPPRMAQEAALDYVQVATDPHLPHTYRPLFDKYGFPAAEMAQTVSDFVPQLRRINDGTTRIPLTGTAGLISGEIDLVAYAITRHQTTFLVNLIDYLASGEFMGSFHDRFPAMVAANHLDFAHRIHTYFWTRGGSSEDDWRRTTMDDPHVRNAGNFLSELGHRVGGYLQDSVLLGLAGTGAIAGVQDVIEALDYRHNTNGARRPPRSPFETTVVAAAMVAGQTKVVEAFGPATRPYHLECAKVVLQHHGFGNAQKEVEGLIREMSTEQRRDFPSVTGNNLSEVTMTLNVFDNNRIVYFYGPEAEVSYIHYDLGV